MASCIECINLFQKAKRNGTLQDLLNIPDGFNRCTVLNGCFEIKPIKYFKHDERSGNYGNCCMDCLKTKKHIYYTKNSKTIIEKTNAYAKENIEQTRKAKNTWYNKKREEDINFKIITNMRARIRVAIKNNYKTGSAVRDLGCSIKELKIHLEKQFQSGMSWDNYGKWHIDHIVPLASFDLTDRDQFMKACHYTNLQPLWAKDNLHKGAKIK